MDDENKFLTDSEIEHVAQRFKILSEGSRLKILRSLFDGEKSVSEIIERTGLLQANVSKQLRILQNNGIVNCRPEGLMRYYKLTDFTVQKICHAVCGRLEY
ncbi:MAG: winged helix-turn-helix transcriptional regulator [Candidatus Kapabacteria bacterium]|nr:winged helix-turn-helix transcriptional regulator [Ignavibacteriota bacterium]MCW5884011.1 winged helix-turn-helix transcriptional regulator [Candidatus Kapabacteria bacterium]